MWDSPLSRSSSSSRDLDFELPGSPFATDSAAGDFPLLYDDSLWDTLISSNLVDIMNTDAFLPAATAAAGGASIKIDFHLQCMNVLATPPSNAMQFDRVDDPTILSLAVAVSDCTRYIAYLVTTN